MNNQNLSAQKKIFALIKQGQCYVVNKKQQSSYSPGKKKKLRHHYDIKGYKQIFMTNFQVNDDFH